MGLFSSLRKDKQESAADDSEFYSRAEDNVAPQPSRSRRSRKIENREAIDPVLPEKKRARRRLIGAIALVLAAIIGLPMIFDSEPKPLATDIAIQIPSRDTPVARRADRPAKPAAKSVAVEAGSGADIKVPQPAESASPAQEKSVVPASPAAAQTAEPTIQKGSADQGTQPDPKKPVAQLAEKSDDAERAHAILSGKSDAAATKTVAERERKADKFVVQVAALASKEKVLELQNKLKKAGIKSFTQKVATQSGERIRVRIGPFASKDEADKARAKVVKLGLNGSVMPA